MRFSCSTFSQLWVIISGVILFLPISSLAQNEIEIISFYAKVYVAPSKNANFIGLTQKGERYPILAVRENWYNIRFKNSKGWVEASEVRKFDPTVAVAEDAADKVLGDTGTDSAVTAETSAVDVAETGDARERKEPPETTRTSRQTVASSGSGSDRSSRKSSSSRSSSSSRRRESRETKREEKKESRLRSWFTQPNLPELPPTIIPNEDTTQTLRYFQVRYPTPVLEFLSPEAPIMGMAKKGQLLQLINEGDSWCRVAFADSVGWIESKHGKIIDPEGVSIDYVKIGLMLGVGVLLIVIVIIAVAARTKKPAKKTDDEERSVKRYVLIVAKTSKIIQYTLTNATTTLDRCFSEVGFEITYAKDIPSIKSYFQKKQPDVVMVDYQFDGGIISSIERICAPLGFGAAILFINYNVPDPSSMHPTEVLPKMAFLGITFSDRDVFKLVTPLLRTAESDAIQKSVQSSALAGDIGEGNLLEVLQFIEIGSKTGCLLIEMEKPYAIICFKNGRIIFAATVDKISGRDAIFKVLDLKIGKFRFVLDKKPKESNVNLSTLEVLMEWAKAVDEAREH